MLDYYAACLATTRRLIRLLALSLGQPAELFDAKFEAPLASLRPLHYTPAISAPDDVSRGPAAALVAGHPVNGARRSIQGTWLPHGALWLTHTCRAWAQVHLGSHDMPRGT